MLFCAVLQLPCAADPPPKHDSPGPVSAVNLKSGITYTIMHDGNYGRPVQRSPPSDRHSVATHRRHFISRERFFGGPILMLAHWLETAVVVLERYAPPGHACSPSSLAEV